MSKQRRNVEDARAVPRPGPSSAEGVPTEQYMDDWDAEQNFLYIWYISLKHVRETFLVVRSNFR